MSRIITILLFIACNLAMAGQSLAATYEKYSQKTFAEAQKQGRPVVLHIWASWCPTCAQQDPAIHDIVADGKFANLLLLRIDFDKEKALLRTLKVTQQSTLIAYSGKKEIDRSTGITDPEALRAILAEAVDTPPS